MIRFTKIINLPILYKYFIGWGDINFSGIWILGYQQSEKSNGFYCDPSNASMD
jgi:hypothetical protein